MKKILIVLIGITLIATFGMNASAETTTDPTGDVWHWHYTSGTYGWDTSVGTKPNIDVTEIEYNINEDLITIALEVAGTISSSELINYQVYLNTSDSYYMFNWAEGQGMGMAMSTGGDSYKINDSPIITVNGNTLSATFDVVGSFTTGLVLWGWAAEYTTVGDTTSEWWADWAPNEQSPYYDEATGEDNGDENGNGDSGDTGDSGDNGDTDDGNQNTNTPPPSGTPGFEIVFLLIAIGIVYIFSRRKK